MLKNMKLRTKLIAAFLIMSFIILVVGVIGINGIGTMKNAFSIAMDQELPITDASMEAMIALISGRDVMGEFMLSEDLDELADAEQEFNSSISNFDKHAGYIAKNGTDALKKLAEEADQYHSVFQENAVELMKHQRLHLAAEEKTDQLMGEFDQHAAAIAASLEDYETELTRDNAIDKKVDASMEAKTFMVEQRAIVKEYKSLQSLSETQTLRESFESKMAEFNSLETLLPEKVVQEHSDFCDVAIKVFDQHDEALRMTEETRNHMQNMDNSGEMADQIMDKVEAVSGEQMETAKASSHSAALWANRIMVTVTLIGFIVGIIFGFVISNRITVPITRIIEGMKNGSEEVAAASGQISSASQQLAAGASEQAASIEETSSSLEEMSAMTKQNAKNAGEANHLMKDANQVVTTANGAMTALTTSMEEISKASEETSKIIKTIDEIAFQTNLLALNAAVEAARAGEAGAGFAVVADEVRNLAMRAAEASKNTADMIEGTVKRVKNGSELLAKTNEAFTKVSGSTGKVGELVDEIAAASNEQAEGIEQVNLAVVEMDKVVQQNTANAEESASASEEMNAQAVQMKQLVVDLMTIVGGNYNGNGSNGSRLRSISHSTLSIRNRGQAVAMAAKGEFASPAAKRAEMNPEKLISMEEENFTDF